jgi:hypothetical protein
MTTRRCRHYGRCMVVPDGHDGEAEILDAGRDHAWLAPARLSRTGLVLAVVALGVGLLVGYLVGHHDPGGAAAQPRPTVVPRTGRPSQVESPPLSAALVLTGNICSEQSGGGLELGAEIANQSAAPLTIRRIRARLPLRGLRPTSAGVGTCGQLAPGPGSIPTSSLAAGATAWVSVTFSVLVRCPTALPVGFEVRYSQGRRAVSTELSGFPDLGGVPYSGCRNRALH